MYTKMEEKETVDCLSGMGSIQLVQPINFIVRTDWFDSGFPIASHSAHFHQKGGWVMSQTRKKYRPFVSPFDPCPPLLVKTYETPPQLYLGFQPPDLPQFSPSEALRHGTLWPDLYAPYTNPYKSP
jgi:spore coat protein JA